ncbi:hypothetical protein [Labilibaculum antarcticum]|nr:hypothetical protein [Labilibaculum antarcticum]
MTNEWKDISKDEFIFEFESLDTVYHTQISHQVRLLSNSAGAPRLFFSEIETPVCADGVCQLAHINVYWDLLGNYVGYGISPEFQLTKFEHEQFGKEDYIKLHQLLLDDNSILKRRKVSDLIDEAPVATSTIDSEVIDGISGATKTEIAESLVKGGLYSCYTIWHLVHGEAQEKMEKYLTSISSDTLMHYFLYAPYNDYQMFALRELPKEDFKEHATQILNIFRTADGVGKAYILKKIPSDILSEKEITSQFYNEFSLIDVNSRTLLINRLKSAHPDAIEILSNYLDRMTRNQLKLYLKCLNSDPNFISKNCLSNLKKASKNTGFTYHYLLREFLNKI